MSEADFINRLNAALLEQVRGGREWRLKLPLPSNRAEKEALDAWLSVLREETGAKIEVDLITEGEA